nr:hypothetical protein [Tanacetum cinerariifolium]
MTNLKMWNSPVYKTFLAYATREIPPKKARKFKKPVSLSKKKNLVVVEEPAEKPTKKPAARRQSAGVQIKDTPGVSVSKKKAPAKAERSKWITFLSEAALLEEAQLKKAMKRSKRETNIHQAGGSSEGAGLELEKKAPAKAERSKWITFLSKAALLEEAQLKKAMKRSKRETNIHQAGGSSEGAGLELEVPNEQKGNDDDNDDQQSDDEKTMSNNLRTSDDEEETQDDEFVNTPKNYLPTDDETNDVDYEEYDRINKEMCSDVNVGLKDTELEGERKDDKEMTDVGHVDVEHENVNQEVVGDQVKDYDQAIVTAAPATQKTEVPLPSSSISFDYATKFLIFDNIPSPDTEIISMMDIKVQHEDPSKATISTTSAPDFTTLTDIHQRLSNLENEVKTLINVNHNSAIHVAIKSEVPTVVKEYLGTSLDDTLHKVIQRHTAELIKEYSISVDVIEMLQQHQKPHKSVADIRKIKMEQAGK